MTLFSHRRLKHGPVVSADGIETATQKCYCALIHTQMVDFVCGGGVGVGGVHFDRWLAFEVGTVKNQRTRESALERRHTNTTKT